MASRRSFLAELKRRNVWRAAVLYAGAAWALSQGVAQLGPAFGMPDWGTRWFVIACVIGFPFWIAFAWFYELTPHGFKRDSEIPEDASARRSNTRKLDLGIIGVLIVAVALLASGYFIHREAPAQAIPAKSIAVLPFENLSSDKQNDYFVAGMQDLILTKLADIGDLKVISRTSTMQYKSHPEKLKKVAAELGVATILEGSVQKVGNQVLINVQLIDAKTDSHIWAQSYTRTLDNIFGVEGEVAGEVATALHAKLSPGQTANLAKVPTTNEAAYDLFLRAEYLSGRLGMAEDVDVASIKAAIPLYRQAVATDPAFALAWARLSETESLLAYNGGGGEDIAQLVRQARADAEQALRLQPELPDAHLAVGYSAYFGYRDYATALKAVAAVLARRPNQAEAWFLQGLVQRRQGLLDDAIASLTRASALDPRRFWPPYALASAYMMARRYTEAESSIQRALALEPNSFGAKALYAQTILYGSGDIPRALAVVQGDALKGTRAGLLRDQRKFAEAIALFASIPDTPDNFGPGGSKATYLATFYWQADDKAQARKLFAKALPLDRAALAKVPGIDQASVWNSVGFDEFGIGHTAAGLEAIGKSEAILDQSHDAYEVPGQRGSDAAAYAMAGRADLAVPLLAKVLAAPGGGQAYSPVMLWLDPAWDPIRHGPRFQALLKQYAEYKPAVTYDNPPASASSTQ